MDRLDVRDVPAGVRAYRARVRSPPDNAGSVEYIVRDIGNVDRLVRAVASAAVGGAHVTLPGGLSFGDFDVINTLRWLGDEAGTHPKTLAVSALITSGR